MPEKLTTWEAVSAWWHVRILAVKALLFPILVPALVKRKEKASLPRLKRHKKKPVHRPVNRDRRYDFPTTKWDD